MGFLRFFSGKLGGPIPVLALCILFIGLSSTVVQAATCTARPDEPNDPDDVRYLRAFGPTVGATVGSIIGATSALNSSILGQGGSAFVSAPPDPLPDQEGGGVWTRGAGGNLTTAHSISTSLADVPLLPNGPFEGPLTTANCSLELKQTYAGMQAGADFARLNLGGGGTNIHFGLTGGYSELWSSDADGGFSGSFRVPYLGLYAVLTSGNFFADFQVRGEFYQNRINDAGAGIFNQKFNATGSTIAGNVGYQFKLSNSWFLEPSAGLLYSKTDVDDINVAGTILLPSVPLANGVWATTMHIGNIDSLLGRASLRVGTSVTAGGILYTPFVTGSYFREFDSGSISSSIAISQTLLPNPTVTCNVLLHTLFYDNCAYQGSISTSRPVSFGQVSVGSSFSVLNTGWLGYLRADYRVGTDISGYSFSGGLRYQFTPGGSMAAMAMATKAPIVKAPIAAKFYDWTGFYVGGFVGGVMGNTGWSYLGATNLSLGFPFTSVANAGFLGGGTWGYNRQMGRWVAGFEMDVGGSNARGGRSVPCPAGFLFTCESSTDWLSTVTGRLGYTFDRLMVYSKGGLAIGGISAASVWNPGVLAINFGGPAPTAVAFRATDTAVGWTLGGGVEFALAQNWSSKAEAMYYDLGSATYQLDAPVRISRTGMIGRVGVNYHFN
jgi:opacity protein-like surface antigen